MVTLQTKTTIENFPHDMGGRADFKDDITVPQDAGRVTGALLFLTIMSKAQNSEMSPLTDIDPALTAASMLCGANGGNLAAWQAVGDGAFQITVDGVALDITGLVFTGVTALTDIASIINIALAGRAVCLYDEVGDAFTFVSPTTGLPNSTITVLTAGSAGTDIGGTTHLNGLTTVGTVTAATGELSSALPSGLFGGPDIAQADIVAGDVENQKVMVKGYPKHISEDKIVLEGGLTLATVIPSEGKTIKEYMIDVLDIVPVPVENDNVISPLV